MRLRSPRDRRDDSKWPLVSDWVYLSIHCGPVTADRIIARLHSGILRRLLQEEQVRGWYYLRWSTPERHLRLRILVGVHEAPSVAAAVMRYLYESEERALVHRVAIDTYTRECDRYGGTQAVEVVERMFQADSECVAAYLPLEVSAGAVPLRTMFACMSLVAYCDNMGLLMSSRMGLLERCRESVETNLPGGFQMERKERTSLAALVERALRVGDSSLAQRRALAGLISVRSQRMVGLLDDYSNALVDVTVGLGNEGLLQALMHLHCNRLFRTRNAECEWLVYDLLVHFYRRALGKCARELKGESA